MLQRSYQRTPAQMRPLRFTTHFTKYAEGSVLVEVARRNIGISGDFHVLNHFGLRRVNWKCLSHQSLGNPSIEIPFLPRQVREDIRALATLRKSIRRAVDNTPLNRIPKVIETGENNRKVTSSLRGGTLEQAVHVFEKNVSDGALRSAL